MKSTLSLTCRAKFISCVTMTMVVPSSTNSRITDRTSRLDSGSKADVGSSNNRARGCMANARAIATLCFSPPDNVGAGDRARCSTPTRSRRLAADCTASSRVAISASKIASVTFSIAVKWGKRFRCWKTMPKLRLKSRNSRRFTFSESSKTSFPSIAIRPAEGRARRLRQRKKVLFPAPLGPTMLTTSPGCTCRLTSSMAGTPLKNRLTLSASITGST